MYVFKRADYYDIMAYAPNISLYAWIYKRKWEEHAMQWLVNKYGIGIDENMIPPEEVEKALCEMRDVLEAGEDISSWYSPEKKKTRILLKKEAEYCDIVAHMAKTETGRTAYRLVTGVDGEKYIMQILEEKYRNMFLQDIDPRSLEHMVRRYICTLCTVPRRRKETDY